MIWCLYLAILSTAVQSSNFLRQISNSSFATWIGNSIEILGPLTLKQITLPGTHDAGTYWLTDVPLPGADLAYLSAVELLSDLTSQPLSKVMKP